MNLRTSLVKKALAKEDIEAFKIALAHDEVIIKYILQIIDYKYNELNSPVGQDQMTDTWACKSAHKEGQKIICSTLKTILEGESNE